MNSRQRRGRSARLFRSSCPIAGSADPPPSWTPAPEVSHQYGLYNEAPQEEFIAAETFCATHPPDPPIALSYVQRNRITSEGCAAWGLEPPTTPRFVGQVHKRLNARVQVSTEVECKSVCILGDLPLISATHRLVDGAKRGVYYEVTVQHMDGIIAIGTACRPYPSWRLPGWNRLSAGLHLDDGRKFFEDPDGGRDYINLDFTPIYSGVTIGCGYEFASSRIFYTYNGRSLPTAFTGVYLPLESHDVFAAVGVEGRCALEVNFGTAPFKWQDANQWFWKLDDGQPPPYPGR